MFLNVGLENVRKEPSPFTGISWSINTEHRKLFHFPYVIGPAEATTRIRKSIDNQNRLKEENGCSTTIGCSQSPD
jgi:hypothetical protein